MKLLLFAVFMSLVLQAACLAINKDVHKINHLDDDDADDCSEDCYR